MVVCKDKRQFDLQARANCTLSILSCSLLGYHNLKFTCQSCLVGWGGSRPWLVRFLVCVLCISFDLVFVPRQGLFRRGPTKPGRGFPRLWIWDHVPSVSWGMGQLQRATWVKMGHMANWFGFYEDLGPRSDQAWLNGAHACMPRNKKLCPDIHIND
jgi:hypothetical protein